MPREGEEWMTLNPPQDEQRWIVHNCRMAVLAASPLPQIRMILEQCEFQVQPIQFLEHFRKTMPMTEAHLDLITTMHDSMVRRLNALEVFYKG
jgi:hypothetical protein